MKVKRLISRKSAILALAAILLLAGMLAANEYVSLNGQFVITYPEGWYQVDYLTVDYYLYNVQATPESFEYEAVFADQDNNPFYDGNYLILTIDKVGEMSRKQIDSLLNDLKEDVGASEQTTMTGDIMTDLKFDQPYYDPEEKTITILSEISDEETVKKNAWIIKFYDQGIANFYFFSPDSLFDDSKVLFNEIVQSFSTENIEASLPKEDLKLSENKDEGSGISTIWIIGGAILLVLVVVIVVMVARK